MSNAAALALVQQLHTLSLVAENRETIVRDQGCLPALVMFMSNEDQQLSNLCLETIHLLAQSYQNVNVMVNEPGLLSGIRKLSDQYNSNNSDNDENNINSENINNNQQNNKKQDPIKLDLITKILNILDTRKSTTFSMKVGDRVPIAIKQNRSSSVSNGNSGVIPPTSTSSTSTPTSTSTSTTSSGKMMMGTTDITQLMGQRVATNTSATAKTLIFFVKGMNNESIKKQVEDCLLKTKGVISFMIDINQCQATIRCTTTADDIKNAVRNTLGLSISLMIDGQEEVDNSPDYLPEINQNMATPSKKGWGWNSIVSFGMSSEKPNQSGPQNGWGWGSIQKALFG